MLLPDCHFELLRDRGLDLAVDQVHLGLLQRLVHGTISDSIAVTVQLLLGVIKAVEELNAFHQISPYEQKLGFLKQTAKFRYFMGEKAHSGKQATRLEAQMKAFFNANLALLANF